LCGPVRLCAKPVLRRFKRDQRISGKDAEIREDAKNDIVEPDYRFLLWLGMLSPSSVQTKFAASSVLPLPLYRATCGYAHRGRVRVAGLFGSTPRLAAMI